MSGAIGTAIIYAARFARVLDIITGSGAFNMLGDLNKAFAEFEAQDKARAASKSAGAGGFSSYNAKKAADALALANAKKIALETKKTAAALLAAANAKKLALAIDKANLALSKGADVFDLDKIQLNAALIGQAEALGKATTGAQILAIANDVQRLKVKQDINALEDAIASKDEAAIRKATAKLNEDLKILNALQRQDFTLLSISTILSGLKAKSLIDQDNLDLALKKIKEMLELLNGIISGTGATLKKGKPGDIPGLPGAGVGGRGADAGRGSTFGKSPLDDFLDAVEAETERGVRRGGGIGGTNYIALPPGFESIDEYFKESRGNRGASDAGTVIVNVNAGAVGDENIIVDAVQNALNEIARRGYLTTYAGAIAG
jgi:hypothetical protein